MKVSVVHNGTAYSAELKAGIDLSIPVKTGDTVNAYYAHPITMEPYKEGDWIGSVADGGPVNYRDVFFNPHGHGTHTECYGHIDETIQSINQHFHDYHLVTQVITVEPTRLENGDLVIEQKSVAEKLLDTTDGVIIRTLPNDESKRTRKYSGQNPPYLEVATVAYLVSNGCKHLILDVPSIDRESDEGKLLGHRAFWNYPEHPRKDCTVTELAYIPNNVDDGLYLLNLQVAPFENDAAPSRPLIFPLKAV
jgi:kynurenine formamidase